MSGNMVRLAMAGFLALTAGADAAQRPLQPARAPPFGGGKLLDLVEDLLDLAFEAVRFFRHVGVLRPVASVRCHCSAGRHRLTLRQRRG